MPQRRHHPPSVDRQILVRVLHPHLQINCAERCHRASGGFRLFARRSSCRVWHSQSSLKVRPSLDVRGAHQEHRLRVGHQVGPRVLREMEKLTPIRGFRQLILADILCHGWPHRAVKFNGRCRNMDPASARASSPAPRQSISFGSKSVRVARAQGYGSMTSMGCLYPVFRLATEPTRSPVKWDLDTFNYHLRSILRSARVSEDHDRHFQTRPIP